jgi:hypothetical protein
VRVLGPFAFCVPQAWVLSLAKLRVLPTRAEGISMVGHHTAPAVWKSLRGKRSSFEQQHDLGLGV